MTGYAARFPPPGPWIERGSCVGAPPDIFFPSKGDHGTIRRALDYCTRCPVRSECLDYAMECGPGLTGIWGGRPQNWRRKAANKAAWKAGMADGTEVDGPSGGVGDGALDLGRADQLLALGVSA